MDKPAPKPAPPPALDLTNAFALQAWIADLSENFADLIATAEDATAPIALRRLGRAEHLRLLGEAKGAVRALLSYASRGVAAMAIEEEQHRRNPRRTHKKGTHR